MSFLATLIVTVVKAVVIAAVAFCGVLFGKHLRVRKNEKNALEKKE